MERDSLFPRFESAVSSLDTRSTSLVTALAEQLDGQVEMASGPQGTTVSVTHATFVSRLPTAA